MPPCPPFQRLWTQVVPSGLPKPSDGLTHGPNSACPRAPRFLGSRATPSYDDSLPTCTSRLHDSESLKGQIININLPQAAKVYFIFDTEISL